MLRLRKKKSPPQSRSSLYEKTKLHINDFYTKLDKDQLTPWSFLKTGKMPAIKKYYGGTVNISCGEFSGTVVLVFWENITPFLEHGISEQLEKVADEAFEKQLNPEPCINEAAGLIDGLVIGRVYNRMAEIDQRLRGKGHPDSVGRKDVSENIKKMLGYLERHKKDISKRATSRYQSILKNEARLYNAELRSWIAIGISAVAILTTILIALLKK